MNSSDLATDCFWNGNQIASLKKTALNNQVNMEGRCGSQILLARVELDINSCSSLLSKRRQAESRGCWLQVSGSNHLLIQSKFCFSTICSQEEYSLAKHPQPCLILAPLQTGRVGITSKYKNQVQIVRPCLSSSLGSKLSILTLLCS